MIVLVLASSLWFDPPPPPPEWPMGAPRPTDNTVSAPEPGTLGILLAAAPALLIRRRK